LPARAQQIKTPATKDTVAIAQLIPGLASYSQAVSQAASTGTMHHSAQLGPLALFTASTIHPVPPIADPPPRRDQASTGVRPSRTQKTKPDTVTV
jgi:hypothetical protein